MNEHSGRMKRVWSEIRKRKYIYLILFPGIIYLLIFSYGPMTGLLLAFKSYKANLGILGSPWVGLKHFEQLLREADFWKAFVNTLQISFGRIIFQFPVPILIAILLNELRNGKFKKIVQTILTFPHFLSWIIVVSLVNNLLQYDGVVNQLISMFGGEPKVFLADKGLIRPLLYFTANWKESGWSSIIFLSAIAAIDPALYEAAEVDGANRLQKIIHITLPGIKTTIIAMLLLNIGSIMNGGFDQIFNMTNSAVQSVTDIIDTYVYRISFQTYGDFGFSTAVGMFKSVINFTLLLLFDKLSRKLGEKGIMGWEG